MAPRSTENEAALERHIRRSATGNEDGINRYPCCAVLHLNGIVCRAHPHGLAVPGELAAESLESAQKWLDAADRTVALGALRLASDGFAVVAVARGKGATYVCQDCAKVEGGPPPRCRGWKVEPNAKTKDPGVRCGRVGCHGYAGAATDGPSVFRMFHEHPKARIGHRPGPGIAVLDADQHADEHGVVEQDGVGRLAKLGAMGFVLPDTLTAATGGGDGRHYYLRIPVGFEIDSTRLSAGGIDVKSGANGLVMVPPQLRSRRAWLNYGHEIAEAPSWLLKAAERVAPVPRARAVRVGADAGKRGGGDEQPFARVIGEVGERRGDTAYNEDTDLGYWLIDTRPEGEKWSVVGAGTGEEDGDKWLRPGGSSSSKFSAKVLVGNDGVKRLAVHSTAAPLKPVWTDDEGIEHKAYSATDLKHHYENGMAR